MGRVCIKSKIIYFIQFYLFEYFFKKRYHTGSLYLGVINGPSEGLQLLSVFYMTGYFYGKIIIIVYYYVLLEYLGCNGFFYLGREFWIQDVFLPFGYVVRLNRIILIFYASVSIITMFFKYLLLLFVVYFLFF